MFVDPSKILVAVRRIDTDQKMVGFDIVEYNIVYDSTLFIHEEIVLGLLLFHPRDVIGRYFLTQLQRARTTNHDFAHVAHVKKTGARPNRHVFLDDPFILNRHLPAGELHHLCARSSMRTVERSPFHCLRHATSQIPDWRVNYLSRWRESLAALSVL